MVLKKKATAPTKEEPKKPLSSKKSTPSKQAEKPSSAPVNELYPATISCKIPGFHYVKIELPWEQLRVKVAQSVNHPIRILMREERSDRKVTELVVAYVGDLWLNAIDINSTDKQWRESLLRVNPKEYDAREASGLGFAVYEIQPKEEESAPVAKPRKTLGKK